MSNILNRVNSPYDIKALSMQELETLASEIREFLIRHISQSGGHLASNLGIVELSLALHCIFDTSRDKIVWDVGHQSYVHKIVTGRRDKFSTLRQFGGISGFPKRAESIHDHFDTGHSSTSISAALGMAKARDMASEKHSVISLIGDGALTGGMAFEALNHAGHSGSNIIVILNDNEMSIAKNVGGLSKYLSKIRINPIYSKAKQDVNFILDKIPLIGKFTAKTIERFKGTIKYMLTPGIIFEELGFKYLGPINGHDIGQLKTILSRAKSIKGPVLIHVCTQKGKGYHPAETYPHKFHGISPFEIETGELKSSNGPCYSSVFGEEMLHLAENNPAMVAITAAMPHGTGLMTFAEKFPNRFFDVGIAEQHAVTFAAGLAAGGAIPVVAIYSSFLQRAYDQILHDVSLQNLHIVFAVDRAGIVGEDGETHHGIYDLSYLGSIPGMTILAPSDHYELAKMIQYAVEEHKGPIAVRFPRGQGVSKFSGTLPIEAGKSEVLLDGGDITLLAVGNMVETACQCVEHLKARGVSAQVVNVRSVKPLDHELILSAAKKTKNIVTIEDNVLSGGFGSSIATILLDSRINARIKMFGWPGMPIAHGTRGQLFKKHGLDAESISSEIMRFLGDDK